MEDSRMPDANDQPLVSVVIPIFREAEILSAFLASVRVALDQCQLPYELVLVDDGSSDDTWRIITTEAKSFPSIRALRLSRNFGKESALCAGLERARGDAVILLDGDGQHPPSLLPEMVRMWRASGADIVHGVKRYRGREPFSGKFGALFFYFILDKLSGFDFKGASDFKLMNRKAVDAWLKMGERNVFFRGMTAWMGFTSVQMPFEVVPRSAGQSTWSYLKRLKLALTGITSFSSLPLQLVTFAGALFLVFSIVLGAETLYLKLAGRAVSGFATVILLELIIGSFLMISLGIIGEYLARIYEEVKGRPRYLVAEAIEPAPSGEGASRA
ncbi:MAG: polyisoprenyl-phosphate glycosyltransferase [Verrucomicrobiota bacterium]|jgi:glycosyltransferase involved in cell wall biosynthesis